VTFFLSNTTVADCTFWKFFIYSKLLFWCSSRVGARSQFFSQCTLLLFTILHNHLLSLISSMLMAFFFTSPSRPSNLILAYSTSSNVHSLLYSWFSANGLSINASNSNSVLFSSRQHLRNFPPDMHVDVAGCNIPVTDSLITLGITLEIPCLSIIMSHNCVNSHSFVFELCVTYATVLPCTDGANAAAVAIFQTCLDYANLLHYSSSPSNICKLLQDTVSRRVINQSNISSAEGSKISTGCKSICALTSNWLS
jgi:hypothetical protein